MNVNFIQFKILTTDINIANLGKTYYQLTKAAVALTKICSLTIFKLAEH